MSEHMCPEDFLSILQAVNYAQHCWRTRIMLIVSTPLQVSQIKTRQLSRHKSSSRSKARLVLSTTTVLFNTLCTHFTQISSSHGERTPAFSSSSSENRAICLNWQELGIGVCWPTINDIFKRLRSFTQNFPISVPASRSGIGHGLMVQQSLNFKKPVDDINTFHRNNSPARWLKSLCSYWPVL